MLHFGSIFIVIFEIYITFLNENHISFQGEKTGVNFPKLQNVKPTFYVHIVFVVFPLLICIKSLNSN